MVALLIHEIGTHVWRRIKGDKQKLKLLGLGLDKYDKGEEGIAIMREQAIGKSLNYLPFFDRYL